MTNSFSIESTLKHLGKDLITELLAVSSVKIFPAGIQLVKEGQYVKYIPLVLAGFVHRYPLVPGAPFARIEYNGGLCLESFDISGQL